jgi:hypothetical protein
MQNRMIRYSIAESINLPPNDAEIHTESTPATVSLI